MPIGWAGHGSLGSRKHGSLRSTKKRGVPYSSRRLCSVGQMNAGVGRAAARVLGSASRVARLAMPERALSGSAPAQRCGSYAAAQLRRGGCWREGTAASAATACRRRARGGGRRRGQRGQRHLPAQLGQPQLGPLGRSLCAAERGPAQAQSSGCPRWLHVRDAGAEAGGGGERDVAGMQTHHDTPEQCSGLHGSRAAPQVGSHNHANRQPTGAHLRS